ncbi:MAG: RNA 2',3'-cyclic phosphodiesterase [Paracoccaceae bacterium]
MRVFIAVELPEALIEALEGVQEGLPGRLVAGDSLHLTLAFLGDLGEARLAAVHEELAGLRLVAPVLRVTALDVFGGKRPNLCFASVAPNPELEAAHRAVARACRAAGIELRRERFRPHVTLARFGRELGAREERQLAGRLGMVPPIEARAEHFALFRSDLGPSGAQYSVLAQYDFD